MSYLLTFSFVVALSAYLGIAARDIRYHYSLDGTSTSVPLGETMLHCMAGTLVTTILSLLIFESWLPISRELRGSLLSIAPICLTAVGLADEFLFHRPRCRKDPEENWNHAVLHFSMGSALVLGYVRWF